MAAIPYHVVIETATGKVMRAGFGVDFINDGAFDAGSETQRTDAPYPCKVKGRNDTTNTTKWDGADWTETTE